MGISLQQIIHLLQREIWEKRRLFSVLYLVTSALFLGIGWVWPKEYTSSSAIFVDEQNILRPLMEGSAVTTDVADRAKLAREIIFSQAVMGKVLTQFELADSDASDVEIERIISEIQDDTQIQNAGRNLIRITYTDLEPMRAFRITDFFTEEFIAKSISAKQNESASAYNFIDSQVAEYHSKLKQAEEALKEFRSQNLDASPGSQSTVEVRIIELRRRYEGTQLELREANIRKEELQRQMSGEVAVSASLSREGQFNERLVGLQNQLEELRLRYHDDYPDIVSIKSQIASIEKSLAAEQESRLRGENLSSGGISSSRSAENALYQELRSSLSATETLIATLKARLDETNEQLKKEEDRIIRINEVDARLAELTRDNQVLQDQYAQLSRQRERAYLSMKIDAENQGVTFKVQEPASVQVTPQGIRFAHFVAAGLIMSLMVPIGIIYGLTLIDQKVRLESVVSETLALPVLASVYHMNTPIEYSLNTLKKSVITFVILASWAVYAYAVWLRLNIGL